MLAAHEGAPLVLRDSAPRLPKQGPPWGIEGEPEGLKNFTLKRPFEAKTGDDLGHTGHYRNQPCRTKTPSVPLISNHHTHQAHTFHRNVALKLPDIHILRPIERARGWRRTTQRAATSTCQHVTPLSHVRLMRLHAGRIPSRAPQIKKIPPLLHARCILFQSPDCVRNEGECRTHRVRVHAAMFARACSCFVLFS